MGYGTGIDHLVDYYDVMGREKQKLSLGLRGRSMFAYKVSQRIYRFLQQIYLVFNKGKEV